LLSVTTDEASVTTDEASVTTDVASVTTDEAPVTHFVTSVGTDVASGRVFESSDGYGRTNCKAEELAAMPRRGTSPFGRFCPTLRRPDVLDLRRMSWTGWERLYVFR